MRNPKLVPYETIVWATSGEPEAIDEVLRHYSKRIRLASLENGQVNKDTEDNIKFLNTNTTEIERNNEHKIVVLKYK